MLVPSLWNESFGLVAAEAMIKGIPVLVSDRAALPEVISGQWAVESDRSRDVPETNGGGFLFHIPERYTPETTTVRRLGSAALDLAYVASGRFDGFYAPNLHPWDAAAGVVLVREAGGLVSNLDGSRYDLYTHDILASNGPIHPSMVAIATQIL
jgi:fructose-1,6-bisphosphatase/inositol monophosphatase family enzyme